MDPCFGLTKSSFLAAKRTSPILKGQQQLREIITPRRKQDVSMALLAIFCYAANGL